MILTCCKYLQKYRSSTKYFRFSSHNRYGLFAMFSEQGLQVISTAFPYFGLVLNNFPFMYTFFPSKFSFFFLSFSKCIFSSFLLSFISFFFLYFLKIYPTILFFKNISFFFSLSKSTHPAFLHSFYSLSLSLSRSIFFLSF